MAGYTSRNFLSLTIPSILGLSIIWFLKKRSSNSKQTGETVQLEDSLPDYHPTLYSMKLKNQEADSVEETVQAEMQLKESESTTEQISNSVSHNPKVRGKGENMTRLCEKGNGCSFDEPITNGCSKDNAPLRNGDSKLEITNGVNVLCLNGVSKAKKPYCNGISKLSEIENMSNGITTIPNGYEKTNGCTFKSEISTDKEDISKTSMNSVDIDKPCQEDIGLAAAKEQPPVDDSIQSSSACNGSSNGTVKSHCSLGTPAEKLTTLSNHTVVVSNGLQSSKISSTSADILIDIDKKLIETDSNESEVVTNGHSETNSEEHSSQLPCSPDTIELSSSPSHSITNDHLAIPAAYVQADNEQTTSINVMPDTEQLASPVDYVVADSTELLTLPIDDIGEEFRGEMLESPGATYCDSLECHPSTSSADWYYDSDIDSYFTTEEMEYQQFPWSAGWHSNMIDSFNQATGSSDSGRGASETQYTLTEDQLVYMVYEFEIFPEDCGRLIGKLGRHVKHINKQTNANIVIKKHPCCNEKKLCAITGTETEINAALKLIRKRFPVEHYPSVTLAQINSIPISNLFSPETLKLSLPEGGVFEALLCSTVSAGHFFLQQPTHPTFYQLPPLTNAMNALYGQTETPVLENPTRGNICAAEIGGGWYRAEVDEVYEDSDNCRLKFLDYGGYADIPKTSIRKIKCDFMLIPFQATECYLAGVMPLDESGWSAEATGLFEQEAQGQLIQGCIVAYAENRVPCVNLYKITGVESVFINQKLINDGLAKGIPID